MNEPTNATMVRGVETIGALVRARRKAAGLTQAQAAGLAGVGNRFMSELERGKKTLELGLVLEVLSRLGLEVAIVPRGVRFATREMATTSAPQIARTLVSPPTARSERSEEAERPRTRTTSGRAATHAKRSRSRGHRG